jgi:hypothetical protein
MALKGGESIMDRRKGIILVTTGAMFWGIGGTAAKKLFQDFQVDVDWLGPSGCSLQRFCYWLSSTLQKIVPKFLVCGKRRAQLFV